MKRKLLLLFVTILGVSNMNSQSYGSAATPLGTTGMTVAIMTDPTTVTLTLSGPSTSFLAIGFGGSNMGSVSDLFIWNSTASRDYSLSGYSSPTADASQSWTIVTENVLSGIRTVVATRALVSAGDYTFVNSTASINIIYAKGSTTSISQHATNSNSTRGSATLTRTLLGTEDFSLKASSVYPNPSNGEFLIKTKTSLEKVNVFTQTGAFVKTIEVENTSDAVEVNVNGLQSGVYLIELVNNKEKSWKKVIVN